MTSSTVLEEVEEEEDEEEEEDAEEEVMCLSDRSMRGRAVRSSSRSAVAKQLSASCSRGRAAVHTAKARPGKDGVGGKIAPLKENKAGRLSTKRK